MERVFQSGTRRCEQAEPPDPEVEQVHFPKLPYGKRKRVFPQGVAEGSEQDGKEVERWKSREVCLSIPYPDSA